MAKICPTIQAEKNCVCLFGRRTVRFFSDHTPTLPAWTLGYETYLDVGPVLPPLPTLYLHISRQFAFKRLRPRPSGAGCYPHCLSFTTTTDKQFSTTPAYTFCLPRGEKYTTTRKGAACARVYRCRRTYAHHRLQANLRLRTLSAGTAATLACGSACHRAIRYLRKEDSGAILFIQTYGAAPAGLSIWMTCMNYLFACTTATSCTPTSHAAGQQLLLFVPRGRKKKKLRKRKLLRYHLPYGRCRTKKYYSKRTAGKAEAPE